MWAGERKGNRGTKGVEGYWKREETKGKENRIRENKEEGKWMARMGR